MWQLTSLWKAAVSTFCSQCQNVRWISTAHPQLLWNKSTMRLHPPPTPLILLLALQHMSTLCYNLDGGSGGSMGSSPPHSVHSMQITWYGALPARFGLCQGIHSLPDAQLVACSWTFPSYAHTSCMFASAATFRPETDSDPSLFKHCKVPVEAMAADASLLEITTVAPPFMWSLCWSITPLVRLPKSATGSHSLV